MPSAKTAPWFDFYLEITACNLRMTIYIWCSVETFETILLYVTMCVYVSVYLYGIFVTRGRCGLLGILDK